MKISVFKDIFIHPKSAFLEIDKNPKNYFIASIAILIINSVIMQIIDLKGIMNKEFEIGTSTGIIDQAYGILFSIFLEFLIVGLIYWIAKKIYKVETNFKRVFSTMTFSYIPIMIINIPSSIFFINLLVDFIQTKTMESLINVIIFAIVILVPLLIWLIILTILACKQSLQLSTGKIIKVWTLAIIIGGTISGIISAGMGFEAMPVKNEWFGIL